MSTISQFSTPNVSAAHDEYWPVYSKEVLKSITEYMTWEGYPCFNSALHVACEYGQSTFLLCEKFQQVTGVDICKTNIKEALSRRHNSDYSNIDFMVGDPHSLPIDTSSVDLLTYAWPGTCWILKGFMLRPREFWSQEGALLYIDMGLMLKIIIESKVLSKCFMMSCFKPSVSQRKTFMF